MSKILQVENLVQEFNLTKDFLDKVKFKNGHFSLENRVVHAVNNVSFDVEQVLSNALKYTAQGSVTIAMDGDDLCIRDTGMGIAPEIIPQLNGLMVQADGSSIRRHGGIGVGLPIARKLIELMGGQLSIASTPGAGSCFSFEIDFAVVSDDSSAG